MCVLAIDTSNLVLSVAVVDDSRVLGEWTSNLNKNHSVTLMDGISVLLDELNVDPEALTGIVVAKGPGSYTGVRIGVATAKSMAWSLGIPVIGISSLEAVGMNALPFTGGIVPLFDARRGQVYTGLYRSKDCRTLEVQLNERIVLLTDWLDLLLSETGDEPLLFLGEDLHKHRDIIIETLGDKAIFATPALNHPRAAHLAWKGLQQLQAGNGIHAHDLVPEYLQLAEAEAKWIAKQEK
ncbi:tRNA (adenosine(37)-N6)-threonylcarbamoyltransferase complex dimerization subunit type 1 TsaB [Brevibacillus laterosporus]|uniref:tRNA (Adenosine(37)-N6)-threonylcarbamoyltransferase complex dimerization subunit type 1 TsaB n=1 Tax=Brevibacillus laterosporus TaxID=1465 RepID=A0A502IYU6_BRELA|nr:tRNA (adenosine(37)-N6)-threonylcarbamoyltransferase complex dimerization subunit type 1 TsaB [Brevibacillus laterosporus]QDX92375.1 tRNA (adenosine(37)-N6)-threonylcarbamoyltransferase complex dimerization subunit type 1 TsaB [Brevibacillus laterosporus]TPG91014.1 tRNA (adenosine(37)-N6)-threonylcarbamoyltransferase complex dimerization subunit type 1 TsaB [Brevibacillus laterosporus]